MNKSLLALLLLLVTATYGQQFKVIGLQCEYKKDPIGIGVKSPKFSWIIDTKQRGFIQSAYRVLVSDNAEMLSRNEGNIWDSKRVGKSTSIQVAFEGSHLKSASTYYWKVEVYNDTTSAWSETAKFTTGLFDTRDWAGAKWIGYEELPDSMKVLPGVHGNGDNLGIKALQRPVTPYFRKTFKLSKTIANALVFISGLGQYELNINGKKVSDDLLTPGWTYYDKTCLYNTYDVTNYLLNGNNAIGVVVGNGFYNINRERYRKLVTVFGNPKMICNLKITYTDGSTEDIVSNSDWKTSPSPIIYNSIYGGEDYDATLEKSGWDKSIFNDEGWRNALIVESPKGKLVADINYPIKVYNSFTVKKITRSSSQTYLYDFGQNAAAIIELKVRGRKGDTIRLTPSELITDQFKPNQKATGEPYYFTYVLKGRGVEMWRPRFTYYGFRYVQVEGATLRKARRTHLPKIIQLRSLAISNSAPGNGSFSCSNQLFNKIFTLINWAIRSNLQSVVTDCPHREKLSWLEQDHLMGASIHYNYDIYNLYKKLVYDMMDAQTEKGLVPDIAPEYVPFWKGFRDSPEWGSSSVILPWMLYNWYGDKDLLKDAYPMMTRYVAYLQSMSADNILSHGLGDWFDYGPKTPGEAQLTPKALTATAIYYYDVKLLSKMSSLIGEADSTKYKNLAADIKQSFNHKFFNTDNKSYIYR